ncbi:MAG: histidinol-phosphate transaminase [Ostreibacterium sp.]
MPKKSLTDIFTNKVNNMQSYHVQSSAGMVKLDAMESPYTLPEDMRQALGSTLSLANINRYPNSQTTFLIAKIKSCFDLPKDCAVMLGNGSDELIQMILMAVAKPGAKVLSPVPSFVMYQQIAEILGIEFIGFDLKADFSIDEVAFLMAIVKYQPSVIFLAYPNNPTGFMLSEDFIRKVIESASGIVILDEAYTAYASNSSATLVAEYDNAVLMRTFSKVGMAGIRLGYLAAKPMIVSQFEKVRMPYNINILTETTARFMLDQMSYMDRCVEKLLVEKQVLYDWLSGQQGVIVYPSETNFLLIRVADADRVFTRLRDDYKILIKNLNGYHPILVNILRITIGRKKENTKLRRALKEILP